MSNSRVLSGARSRRANDNSANNGFRQTVSIGGRQIEMPLPGQQPQRMVPQPPMPPQNYTDFDQRFVQPQQFSQYQQPQRMPQPQQQMMQQMPPPLQQQVPQYKPTEVQYKVDPAQAEEYENRFAMLANEIAELKDIVLKLQSYTMEVNKTLMQERVQILSDLGSDTDKPPMFVMSSPEQPTASD
jgi:hypothetical protein